MIFGRIQKPEVVFLCYERKIVMKKYRKGIASVLLMLTMVFGSFSFAFADEGIGAMSKVTALPGYNSITLTWKNVNGATDYQIHRSDWSKWVTVGNVTSFKDKTAKTPKVTYAYEVRAVRKDGSGKTIAYSDSKSVSTQIIRQMYQKIYLSSGQSLYSHAGGSQVRRHFSSSQPIIATGFGGGKFKFWDGTGSRRRLFYVSYTKVRKATGDYFLRTNYSLEAAENFVNDLGIKKSKRSDYLIWVSTNTQHLYIFKYDWNARRWKLFNLTVRGKNVKSHWEVATGEASNPTIISMNLQIQFKDPSNSGIPWWNCFSGYNAIHGKKASYVIDGRPHSHGCVRNYNHLAEWIYKNCPNGTPVVIF